MTSTRTRWRNWAGNQECTPAEIVRVNDVEHLQATVAHANADGLGIRVAGAGHSFTPLVCTDDVIVDISALHGIVAADPGASSVTVWAGSTIRELGPTLWELGLSLRNQGDIDVQTIGGAAATATHGSGLGLTSVSGTLRRIAGDSGQAEAIKVLARAHQNLIWARTRHTNGLRSALREYYPAALEAFEDLADRDALAILGRAPTPADAGRLSLSKIRSALKAAGRQRNLDTRALQIQEMLRTEQLAAPAAVTAAFGASTRAAVGIIAELNHQIADLEAELATHFETHPDADIYRSLPGLGVILGARVLGEFGDDPNRYTTAKCRKNYAGTSPLTIASGKKRAVLARHVRNRRLYDAVDQWAFCAEHQPRRPHLLRPTPRRRRPAPPSTTRPGQPPRRHPARLPAPPHRIRRTQSMGTPPTRPQPLDN